MLFLQTTSRDLYTRHIIWKNNMVMQMYCVFTSFPGNLKVIRIVDKMM